MALQVGVTIDRSSPVPLYHQLAEQLRSAIDDGRLKPGDPFENEIALAERLDLSRPTVRRAIQELVGQGLLLRRRGLGTTVANRKVHRRAGLTSLYEDLERAAGSPSTVVLGHEMVRDERIAAELDLPPDTDLLAIVRLRLAAGQPLAILRNWLPPRSANLSAEELSAQGLYALLRARGVRAVVAHQEIGARTPTAFERRQLGLKASEPVLTMTRSAFDAAGVAVEYGDHCYRARDYTVDVTIDER
ncbi:GntR family transcriptional regulator [Asanoa iriomotensis]|uniref:GntR family transcriptional regulator n=1 Tax=Asanoa iriomotensis TaxID=234613 RepID=A0ABQ4C1D1_9ACTN|nr:GntR family transcriptional regulator [Asanoa iriomotensis]GIF56577.1 GntR family transcriptional regulator [Asanoa iriomotensis]